MMKPKLHTEDEPPGREHRLASEYSADTLEHAISVLPWMAIHIDESIKIEAYKNAAPIISIFDKPGQGGFRFAIRRGEQVEFHRYSPQRGYDFPTSKRLRIRIGRALVKAHEHDWDSPKPFICEL